MIFLTLLPIALGLAARFLLLPQPALALLFAAATLAAIFFALAKLGRQNTRPARLACPLLFGFLILWLWEMLVVGIRIPFILLPPPSLIFLSAYRHAGILGEDFAQTYLHSVLIGYAIGCAAGFCTALAIDRSPFLQRGLTPLANAFSAIPIIGIAPITIQWFGFGWPSKAAVVVLMTFFPMLVSTAAGLAQTGAMERDLMRSYAAPYLTTLLKLRLPAAMPMIFAALKLNSTLALIGAVVAEFFGTPTLGMGFRISTESARMNLDIVWATITVAALAGSISFGLIAWAERLVTFWHPSFHNKP